MSASPCSLKSPPPRLPPEGRAQTRSSGAAASPCGLCSPPARESVRSPMDVVVAATEDPVALVVETWCSPTLVSPAGRECSVMQLQQQQAAGPLDISNPFLEDEQWDMEAMVLSTIAGQIEDEDEQEEEVPCGTYNGCDDVGAFSGWALESRGALVVGDKSSSAGTPSGAASDVKSDGSRLPTTGTAQERKDEHFKMASEQGHATFACGCHIARARGSTSCLDRFGKEQFRRWHNETYGVTADGSNAKHLDPSNSIHAKVWALKEPLPDVDAYGEKAPDAYGRKWRVKNWKLDGHEVCCQHDM